jgi:hypothetical protein
MKLRLLLATFGFWSFLGVSAGALTPNEIGAPARPDQPTKQACENYQTRLNDWYREAQAESKRCGSTCSPVIAGRLSYGSGRVGYIASCFAEANQRSQQEQVLEFLRRDSRDSAVSVLGVAGQKARKNGEEIAEWLDLKKRITSYSTLNDDDKLSTNQEIAKRLNKAGNYHSLSKELTDNAIDHVVAKHREALTLLDVQLKALVTRHSQLLSRGKIYASLSRRVAEQRVRSADADRINIAERRALVSERRERNAENEALAQANRARRQRDHERQLAAIAAEHAEQLRQQENAQELFRAFAQGLSGAMSAMPRQSSGPSWSPPPATGGGATSSGGGGSTSGLRCRPGESVQRCIHR